MRTKNSMLTLDTLEDHMVLIEGGSFMMGDGQQKNNPPHEVKLTDFYLCRFQVSQSLWESVMQKNESNYIHPERPVEGVHWYDAILFCNRLSELKNRSPYYKINDDQEDPNNRNEYDDLKWRITVNPDANGYRLPTEAEWEYAARGGKYIQEEFTFVGSNSLSEVAWHDVDPGNSQDISQPIGFKRPNALGLFDMSGNLDEWCQDWFGENYYQEGIKDNPKGPESGLRRVVRGCSWFDDYSDYFRPSFRSYHSPYYRSGSIGFRLSRY